MKPSKKAAQTLANRRKGWDIAKLASDKHGPSAAKGWKRPGSLNPRKS